MIKLVKKPTIKTNSNWEYFFENIINYLEWVFLKHSTVLLSKHAMVMGPTPPGTGVIAFAILETEGGKEVSTAKTEKTNT